MGCKGGGWSGLGIVRPVAVAGTPGGDGRSGPDGSFDFQLNYIIPQHTQNLAGFCPISRRH
jgi:hypothetical protein